MMRPSFLRVIEASSLRFQARGYATARHLMSIGDVSPSEFTKLVLNAASHKKAVKAGQPATGLRGALAGQTVAMMFSKRSTRTRVSTEAAVALMGGHPMFLGKDDIQLGAGSPRRRLLRLVSGIANGRVRARSTSLCMTPPGSSPP